MSTHEEDLRVVAKVLSEFNVDLPHGYQRVQARAILDALAPAFARARVEGAVEALREANASMGRALATQLDTTLRGMR